MTHLAFQVNEFNTTLKMEDGSILRSNGRPAMSFDYDVLTFTESDKTRFWNNERIALTDDEIVEVQAYVDGIVGDENLSILMSQIHQSKSILAATDWYIIRHLETGKAVPENITQMRVKARELINDAESQL